MTTTPDIRSLDFLGGDRYLDPVTLRTYRLLPSGELVRTPR